MTATRARVLFALEWLPGFTIELHQELRGLLAEEGIELAIVHGDPPGEIAARAPVASLDWATRVPNRTLAVGPHGVFWQPVTDRSRAADLVIVDQASRALFNYWLLAQQRRGRTRMAFWGHGANLNRPRAIRAAEWVKRRMSSRAHWWFAHTEGARQRVRELGYPDERITVVQNASDTVSLRAELDALSSERRARSAVNLGSTT